MSEETKKSFAFRPSPETLRQFKNASAEEKLNWLENAAEFVRDFVPEEKLEQWKKIAGKK